MIFINANGVIELNKKIFESIKVIIDCAWLGPKIINNNHINTTQGLDPDEKNGWVPCLVISWSKYFFVSIFNSIVSKYTIAIKIPEMGLGLCIFRKDTHAFKLNVKPKVFEYPKWK